MTRPRVVVCTSILIAVTACGTGTTATTASTTLVPETTTTEAPTSSVAAETATSAAVDAAPPELAGQWRTQLDTGDPTFDRVFVSFRGTQFALSQGGFTIPAKISVNGDQIRFYGGLPINCDGEGVYQWSIEEEALTFTALEPLDPCPRRLQALDGVSYTR